jgi:exodeoxyribonuclease V alpha subunit
MSILNELLALESVSASSVYFARFLAERFKMDVDDKAVITAALLCESGKTGNVCLDLSQHAGRAFFDSSAVAGMAPELNEWIAMLEGSPFVAAAGTVAPMILSGERLYLHRQWTDEQAVGASIMARVKSSNVNLDILKSGLVELYPNEDAAHVDWQKLAAAQAVLHQFTVISGGPGTGKTTTVVKVLSLLLAQDPTMKIRLAAPTGKAAARMVESIRGARKNLQLDPLVSRAMPDEASTIHRLLGQRGGNGRRLFRHNNSNPLHMDCLVIDEASMIDLSLMRALLDALPLSTRLILLGDRDQLASVDAGNVLGDITGHGTELAYSEGSVAALASLCGVEQSSLPVNAQLPEVAGAIALLRTSYRFTQNSGIGQLARLVNTGDAAGCRSLLNEASKNPTDLLWMEAELDVIDSLSPQALEWAVARYGAYLQCQKVEDALETLAKTRVLCAVHNSPFGDIELNRLIADRLRRRQLLEQQENGHGTPVMITVNDYELELYNGDIGLLWRSEVGVLEACFGQLDGAVRRLPVQSLPQFVPAWALTVHKSQGSEFDEVMLVLPSDTHSPLLSRELLYTGITRARNTLVLCASAQALNVACQSVVKRSSGLADLLGW